MYLKYYQVMVTNIFSILLNKQQEATTGMYHKYKLVYDPGLRKKS